jgi:16S rRNA C967 or C1407 C5-methylase (RsmB/RsmF family)
MKLMKKLPTLEFQKAMKEYDAEVKADNRKVNDHLNASKKFMEKVTTDLEKMRDELKLYDEKLADKLSSAEGEQLWANFTKYAIYQDFKDLYAKTIPPVKKIEERMIQQNVEFEKIHLMIRRFDEIMSDKVNKIELAKVNRDLMMYQKVVEF